MVKCPECGKEYDKPVSGFKDNRCPECGESLLKVLPGYPDRYGSGVRDSLTAAWDIFSSNIHLIILYLFVPILVISLINTITFWQLDYIQDLGGVYSTGDAIDLTNFTEVLSITIGMQTLFWIFQLAYLGGIVKISKDAFVGKKVRVINGLKGFKDNFNGLIGSSIILVLLITGGFVLSTLTLIYLDIFAVSCFGFIFYFFLSFLFLYWFLYTIPLTVIKNKNISDSMVASKKLSNDKVGTLKVIILIVIILSSVSPMLFFLQGWIWSPDVLSGEGLSSFIYQLSLQGLVGILQYILFAFCMILITVHYIRVKRVDI